MFKKILKLFLPVYLSLIICIVFEFSLSLYYRVRPDEYITDPYRFAIPVPGYNSPFIYLYKYQPGNLYQRNNIGVRRGTDSPQLPVEGTKRILSYGDSVGLGYEMQVDETYSSIMEQSLNNASEQSYEVLNMSRGNSPSIYAANMKHDLPELKPHAVVVEIELLNDTSDEAAIEFSGTDQYSLPSNITRARYWPEWQTMPPISPNMYPWETLFMRKFLLDTNRKLQVTLQKFSPNPIFAPTSDIYFYNLGYDQYYLTQSRLDNGFTRMFAVLAGMNKYVTDKEMKFLLVILPSRHYYEGGQFTPGAIRMYEKAVAEAKKRNIPHVGLADLFGQNGGAWLFFDYVHPTKLGHTLIGNAAAEKFAQFITCHAEFISASQTYSL